MGTLTVNEIEQKAKKELVKDLEWGVAYHTRKLVEELIKLESVSELTFDQKLLKNALTNA